MPVMLIPESPIPDPFPDRKRFTRDEVSFLVDNNILTERYELIDGEIVIKMQNPPHNTFLILIAIWLEQIFGRQFVRTQQAIEVADADCRTNYPEPDIAVTVYPVLHFAAHHPNPEDLYLIVEVADSTYITDKNVKSSLYARAAITEYWLADVKMRQIIVHREPAADGYSSVNAYTADEEIAPLARPEAKIRVKDLFPPDISFDEA